MPVNLAGICREVSMGEVISLAERRGTVPPLEEPVKKYMVEVTIQGENYNINARGEDLRDPVFLRNFCVLLMQSAARMFSGTMNGASQDPAILSVLFANGETMTVNRFEDDAIGHAMTDRLVEAVYGSLRKK